MSELRNIFTSIFFTDLLNKLLAHPPETLMQIFNLCAEIKSKDIKESFKVKKTF